MNRPKTFDANSDEAARQLMAAFRQFAADRKHTRNSCWNEVSWSDRYLTVEEVLDVTLINRVVPEDQYKGAALRPARDILDPPSLPAFRTVRVRR